MRSPAGSVRAAIAALALSALALTGCASSDEPAEPSPQQATTASSAPSAEQRVPAEGTTGIVTVTDDSVILGDPDAPERVHIYQDLNCPHRSEERRVGKECRAGGRSEHGGAQVGRAWGEQLYR